MDRAAITDAVRVLRAGKTLLRERTVAGPLMMMLWSNIGAMTGLVGPVRTIVTERGYTVAVHQLIADGDRAHAHLTIQGPPGASAKNMKPNDKRELVGLIVRTLDTFETP